MITSPKLICFLLKKEQFPLRILHLQAMSTSYQFSSVDIDQMQQKGVSPDDILGQLDRFCQGFPPLQITAPATIEHGILQLTDEEIDQHIRHYDAAEVDVLKFVPASGAATRMFKNLFSFLQDFDGSRDSVNLILREKNKTGRFFTELDEFAFYDQLDQLMIRQHGISCKEALQSYKHNLVVESLLLSSGMNYGNLPKGLLSFHKYDRQVRTAAQEHLAEGLDYASKRERVHVHFTVSASHRQTFEEHIKESIDLLDIGPEVSASFSVQFGNTDTIAATLDINPFRDEAGKLLFRPAGHGALLQNLNELFADIIFIKNIDNVVPDRLRMEGVRFKKALAGILLSYQERAHKLLKASKKGRQIVHEASDLLNEMGIQGNFTEEEAVKLLDRPIRVCGMVKNEGEPGGGPFWVRGKHGDALQIVESAQVNAKDESQQALFNQGTHFNPVDIVCGVKNYKGEKFDLLKFRDENAGFISEKSFNGQQLLAMELPGLWNGGMANWNTIFVEVPLVTFNPVKTVTDLLKPAHR